MYYDRENFDDFLNSIISNETENVMIKFYRNIQSIIYPGFNRGIDIFFGNPHLKLLPAGNDIIKKSHIQDVICFLVRYLLTKNNKTYTMSSQNIYDVGVFKKDSGVLVLAMKLLFSISGYKYIGLVINLELVEANSENYFEYTIEILSSISEKYSVYFSEPSIRTILNKPLNEYTISDCFVYPFKIENYDDFNDFIGDPVLGDFMCLYGQEPSDDVM